MPTQTFNSSGLWTAPAGVTSVDVQCWGGGGGGAYPSEFVAGGGGGGGAYAASTVSVTPGNNYTVTVGAGGTGPSSEGDGGAGGDSSFNGTSVVAKGGTGGTLIGDGGASGSAGASTGTTKFSGGNGGLGDSASGAAGGGGSSAGTAANGTDGGDDFGDPGVGGVGGTAPAGGGDGGDGSSPLDGPGQAGSAPGGGGGGLGNASSGSAGAGAAGRVVLTWTGGGGGSAASDTGYRSPTQARVDSGIGTVAWTNPEKIIAADAAYAMVTMLPGESSQYLVGYLFGGPSVPTTATVVGVQVEIDCRAETVAVHDLSVRLVVGGVVAGDNKSNNAAIGPPGADGVNYRVYGGPSDLWGLGLTVNGVNGGDFGVAFAITNPSGVTTFTTWVEHVRVKIYYTPGPPYVSPAAMLMG